MSGIIETYLVCDKCQATFGKDKLSRTLTKQWLAANEQGWTKIQGQHFCPNCSFVSKTQKLASAARKLKDVHPNSPYALKRKKQLAETIKARLEELKMSQTEFATLMDKQPSTITRWLSGFHNFTLFTLYNIEKKLSIQLIDYEK